MTPPDDPSPHDPPLMVLEPAGGPTVPLVVHVPHGGTRIPAWVRRGLSLDDERLEDELVAMTDWHTPQLYAPPAVTAGGVAVVNRLSRLVVDPERLPDAREPMAAVGMGAVYTRTADGSPLRADGDVAARVALLDRCLQPWAEAVERAVDDAVDRHGRCLVLDGHSFPSRALPYEDAARRAAHGGAGPAPARPDVCLGFEDVHALPELVAAMTGRCRAHGFTVAHNEPFAGSYVPLSRYGLDRRVRSVMVELNRGRHLDEATGERGPGFAGVAALASELTALAAEAAASGW